MAIMAYFLERVKMPKPAKPSNSRPPVIRAVSGMPLGSTVTGAGVGVADGIKAGVRVTVMEDAVMG